MVVLLVQRQSIRDGPAAQATGAARLAEIVEAVDASAVLETLRSYRLRGRKGYPLEALWRAYLASFVLNLPSTNALIRRLEDTSELLEFCGFEAMPHRTTFNRYVSRLSSHVDLVDECLHPLTRDLAQRLPGLGQRTVQQKDRPL